MKTVLIILLTFCFAFPAIRYVNDTGDNGNNGSSWSQAYLTLVYAESQVSDGDTVYIGQGTFKENGTLNCLYIQKAVTWIGAPDSSVTIQSQSTSYVLIHDGAKSARFENIIFDGEQNTNYIVYQNGSFDNKYFYNCSFKNPKAGYPIIHNANTTSCDNVTFDNCTFTDNGINASYVFNYPNVLGFNLLNSTITLTGTTPLMVVNGLKTGNINIANNIITSSGSIGAFWFVYIYNTGRTVRIDSNRVTFSSSSIGRGAFLLDDQVGIKFRNNFVDMSSITSGTFSSVIIGSSGTDLGTVYVQNNIIKSSRTGGIILMVGTDVPGAGDEKLDGAYVENNRIYGPMYFDKTQTSTTIHGLEYGHNKYGFVRYNYVNGCGLGLVIKGDDLNWSGVGDVSYNIIQDCGPNDLMRIKGVDSVAIYNNNLLASESVPASTAAINVTDSEDDDHNCSHILIKNNLFAIYNGSGLIKCEDDGSILTPSEVDYNLFWNSIIMSNDGSDYISLSDWQAAGFDLNSWFKNPLIYDDYRIDKRSPAKDAGVNLNMQLDYFGESVDSTPNIGASELIINKGSSGFPGFIIW